MKLLNFLKRHIKAAIILGVIAVATTVGVVLVRASTVTIMVDKATVAFSGTNKTETLNATVNLSLDPGVSSGTYAWSVGDPEVATIMANEGNGTITSKGAGKTTVNITYTLSDGTNDSKVVPIIVPLTVNSDRVKGVMKVGNSDIVTCDAAKSKYVEWTSSNSNVVSVVADTSAAANGSIATITAVSGGTAVITCSIPSDSLAAMSFTVTVGVSIDETEVTVEQGGSRPLTTNSQSVQDVYWWSDNPNVATVRNGVVYGVYAGTTTVYGSCIENDKVTPNASDSVTVTVPYKVTVPSTTVLVGDLVNVSTTADPSQVNYQSSNNNVLYYDVTTGKFKANSTGTSTISVSWNGQTEYITIEVIDGFSLSTNSLSLNIGTSGVVQALVSNVNQPVHWSVSDVNMVDLSASEDGLSVTVTAKETGAYGYTTLVATQEINGVVKSAECRIYVTNPVSNLTLLYNGNPVTDIISAAKGTGVYITAYLNFGSDVVPANTNLRWVTSDPGVVTATPVTTSGQQQLCQINAVGGGYATITVVTEDGLYIATADFYVTEGVTSITLDNDSVTAQMALEKYQLKATVLPDTDGVDKTVIWTSLDPSVVKVDQNGLVTFVGPGETYVSATSGADTSQVAYCKFHITQQVEGITMDFDKVTLNVKDEYRLTAVIKPSNATNQKIIWSSSNDKIVRVDNTGMITAVASGNATIIAQTEDGGYIDMTNVTVLQPVTSIQLSQTELSVKKGTEFWLNATVLPETADNKKVIWSSSDTSLATVAPDGRVNTLACGTVTISCVSADNGTAAYCIVDITEPVTGLVLNTNYQELVAGTKFVIVPTVLPFDAINKAVTYLSSDSNVATVDANGIVSAIHGGTCEIIVTTVESSVTATCTIVVKEFVTSVKITGSKEYLNVSDSIELGVEVGSETATNKGVIWKSSNTNVATVDQRGKVTGVNVGYVVITATAADGSGVSDAVIIKVINPVTTITLSESKVTIFVDDTINIKATVNPPTATVQNLVWTSDNEEVAKVYPDGDVTGISPGRTIVHATSTDGNDVVASCTIIVKARMNATSIRLNSSEITMLKGKTRKLTANIYPTKSTDTVHWMSSDTSIVKVDENGNIITVGAGTCEVIAYSTSGSVEDVCVVHSIAMSCTSLKMEQYDSFNLYVDGAPSAVSWRSSNPRIASVDRNGVVTGRMPGECVITGTVNGKTVTCNVKILAVDPGKFINSDFEWKR
ncbi:MAG: Ig-like domain-containing protein [Butyrivibrio sp.]